MLSDYIAAVEVCVWCTYFAKNCYHSTKAIYMNMYIVHVHADLFLAAECVSTKSLYMYTI